MYYIAYGSNLNKRQMSLRCPDSKIVGTTVIEDYQLLFKGLLDNSYLTIEPKKGYFVPVAVFEVSESDIKNLDTYEGFPELYFKCTLRVKVNNEELEAFLYIMNNLKCNVPSELYYNVCRQGYEDFNFDKSILDKAIMETVERL